MKKTINEFKTFIKRGNVLDLAVALLLGSAFTAIVNSLANDLIMPIVSIFLSGIGLKQLKLILRHANEEAGITEIALHYGNFLQAVINFLILALCVFVIVKIITHSIANINEINEKAKRRYEKKRKKLEKKGIPVESQPTPPEPEEKIETTQELLVQIRDLLKNQQNPDEKIKLVEEITDTQQKEKIS